MKKVIKTIMTILTCAFVLTGCGSVERACVTMKSNLDGGLNRTIKVYTANGELIAEHSGKIDIEGDGSYMFFDFNGKRYIYMNCFVESIADI